MAFRPERIARWYGVVGGAFAIATSVFGILVYFIPSPTEMTGPTVSAAVGAFVFVIIVFSGILLSFERDKKLISPRILQYRLAERLVITEPSDAFGMGMGVTIYLKEDEYERVLASGFIRNVQADGKLQILITKYWDGHDRTLRELAKAPQKVIREMIVKIGNQIETLDV